MTPAEREQSEARRKLIHSQNRANNPRRPNRVIEQPSLQEDLDALLNIKPGKPGSVDWRSLTANG